MVQELKGSKELKEGLPYGALGAMAVVFGHTPDWISRVVEGKNESKKKIVECAFELSEVEAEKKEAIDKILDEYTI